MVSRQDEEKTPCSVSLEIHAGSGIWGSWMGIFSWDISR